MNQDLPGTVCTQLLSCPAGGLGPKYTSTEPSAFVFTDLFWLLTLGKRATGSLRVTLRAYSEIGPVQAPASPCNATDLPPHICAVC